jgi:hypothetical protein
MSQEIAALKAFIRAFLRENMEPVPPQRATSGKVHLEVWRSPGRRRPVGLEMDHDAHVNLWLVRMNVPQSLPASVGIFQKEPKGRGWTDAAGDGANSNLSSYDEFRTKRITRLAVSSIDDARIVLEALLDAQAGKAGS